MNEIFFSLSSTEPIDALHHAVGPDGSVSVLEESWEDGEVGDLRVSVLFTEDRRGALVAWAGEWDVQVEGLRVQESYEGRFVHLHDGRTMRVEGTAAELFGAPVLLAAIGGHPASLNFIADKVRALDEVDHVVVVAHLRGATTEDKTPLSGEELAEVAGIIGVTDDDAILYAKDLASGLGYVIEADDIASVMSDEEVARLLEA